jgi:hypothetical protein
MQVYELLSIGMVLMLSESHPEMGRLIGAVILSSVIIYEGIGPFLTRLALRRAKEIYLQEQSMLRCHCPENYGIKKG